MLQLKIPVVYLSECQNKIIVTESYDVAESQISCCCECDDPMKSHVFSRANAINKEILQQHCQWFFDSLALVQSKCTFVKESSIWNKVDHTYRCFFKYDASLIQVPFEMRNMSSVRQIGQDIFAFVFNFHTVVNFKNLHTNLHSSRSADCVEFVEKLVWFSLNRDCLFHHTMENHAYVVRPFEISVHQNHHRVVCVSFQNGPSRLYICHQDGHLDCIETNVSIFFMTYPPGCMAIPFHTSQIIPQAVVILCSGQVGLMDIGTGRLVKLFKETNLTKCDVAFWSNTNIILGNTSVSKSYVFKWDTNYGLEHVQSISQCLVAYYNDQDWVFFVSKTIRRNLQYRQSLWVSEKRCRRKLGEISQSFGKLHFVTCRADCALITNHHYLWALERGELRCTISRIGQPSHTRDVDAILLWLQS